MAGGGRPEKTESFSRDSSGSALLSPVLPNRNSSATTRHAPCASRAPFLIALLGLVFFAPLLLHPSDTLYSKRSDMIAEHIPAKRFLIRSCAKTGELPLWCPDQFGGEPFVHDPQVGVFYPPYWFLFLFPPEAAGCVLSWLIVGHVVAAGCLMYGYALSHGLGRAGATAAAMSYMFAGKWMFHLLDAGHTVVIGLAWVPLVLLLLESAVRRGSLVRATAAGAAAALMVLGTQPQWTMYSAMLAAGLTLGTALESAGWLGGAGPRSPGRTLAAPGPVAGAGPVDGAGRRRPVRGAAAAHAGGGVAGQPRRRRGARRSGPGLPVHRA